MEFTIIVDYQLQESYVQSIILSLILNLKDACYSFKSVYFNSLVYKLSHNDIIEQEKK